MNVQGLSMPNGQINVELGWQANARKDRQH